MLSFDVSAANEAARRYLETFGGVRTFCNGTTYAPLHLRYIYIDASVRGPREPFYLKFSEKSRRKHKYPVYLSYANVARLIERRGLVFGRTQWGPWCLIFHRNFEVYSLYRVEGSNFEREFNEYYNAEFGGE